MKSFNLHFPLIICLIVLLAVKTASAQSGLIPINASTPPVVEKEIAAIELSRQWNADSIQRSINFFLEASTEWKNLRQPDKASNCLREAARLYIIRGNYKQAYTHLANALKIESKKVYSAGKSQTLSLLSQVAFQTGEIVKSKKFFIEALVLSKLTGDAKAQAMALFSAAEFYYYQQNIDQPVNFYQQSLKFWQKANDSAGEAKTLLGLSYAYINKNEPETALEYANLSMTKWQEINDKRGQAITYTVIGHLNTIIDKNQTALDVYQKAEALYPENIDFFEKAVLFNAIGSVFEEYGQWRMSLSYRKKAFELYQKEEHLSGQLATLPSLIKLSFLCADEISAFEYFEQVWKLAEKLNDKFYLAIALEHIGDIHFEKKSDSEAVNYYEESLKILKKLGFRRDVAQMQDKLGTIYERQGKFERAREFYTSALKTSCAIKNKFAEAQTLYNLARLNDAAGQSDLSLDQIRESLAITESIYGDVANNKLRRTYLSNVYERYEFYIHLLMELNRQFPQKNYDVLALEVSERGRARTLLESLRLAETEPLQEIDPELAGREKNIRRRFDAKATALTELLTASPASPEAGQLNNEIEELSNEYENLNSQLKLKNPAYAALIEPEGFNLSEFQEKFLDEKTLLAEFSFGRHQSYLWLVSRTEVTSVTLPPRQSLEPRIQRLLKLLTDRGIHPGETLDNYRRRIANSETTYWQEAQSLSNDLFGQIADKLADKRLIVIPDGAMSYLPISAFPLPASDSNETFINDPFVVNHEIVYEPSATTLQFLENNRKPNSSANSLLVFADGIFSRDDTRVLVQKGENSSRSLLAAEIRAVNSYLDTFRSTEAAELPRLFASQKEAENIRAIAGADRTHVLSGFEAKREKVVVSDLAEYRIIHFATHAVLNEELPELSGIVLSLYDEKGDPQHGILRLHDIYNLNLSADLVVLSACNSGIGGDVRGEGLISLTRGFMQSGAKSVLSSSWKVSDNAVVDLMKTFYQSLLAENLQPAAALRQAQLKMLRDPQLKFPFYWASFTLHGEFRRPIALGTDPPNWAKFFRLIVTFFFIFAVGYLIYKLSKRTGI